MPSDESAAKPETPRAGDPAPSGELVGRRLGDFLLHKILGRGGMGEVYLAEQTSLKRPVAVKVLRKDLASDPSYLRRFEAEAKTAAPIRHPNVVQVIAIGAVDGVHFMALEYVPGMNLREYVARKGPLSAGQGIGVLRRIASALEEAHEHGVVHRDVKPENVLLTKKGEVKVADFGLARLTAGADAVHLTKTGVTMGTPLYMSPEQFEGKDVDARSDLYSLGILAYFAFAGKPPYRGETALAVALRHVQASPEDLRSLRPELPEELCRVVARLMKKSPDERYQSAAEALRDLEKLGDRRSAGESNLALSLEAASGKTSKADAPAAGLLDQTAERLGFKRRPIVVAASLIVATLAGAATGFVVRRQSQSPRPPASAEAANLPPIEEMRNGALQRLYADSAADEPERIRRLWAVLAYHPGDEVDCIRAACELARHYLARRDYRETGQVARALVDCDDKSQQMVGRLLAAIVDARQGRTKEAVDQFFKMRESARATALDPNTLSWLATQYQLAAAQASDAVDAAKRKEWLAEMNEFFRKNLLPATLPRRG